MARVILRFIGKGQPPDTDVAQIQSTPGLHVVDQSSRMLLVEADESELRDHLAGLDDWRLTIEKSEIRVPDPKPKVRPSPEG